MVNARTLIPTLGVLLVLAVSAGVASAKTRTRDCRPVTVSLGGNGDFEGQAHHIVATNVSCRRARHVAAQCVRGSHRGWHFDKSPGARSGPRRMWGDQFSLTRARAIVSFYIAGGGGCDPHQP